VTSTCLVFDVETVPDVELGRRIHGLDDGIDDAHVGEIMLAQRRQRTGSEFLSFEQHRVVAISVVLRSRDQLKVWSLGEPHSGERELLERFFHGIEELKPDLVSWNGTGFDLPVLHYRALRHGVAAPRYWETGDDDPSFRFNNYLSRYHWRHCDLMDVLSNWQGRGRVGLESAALLLGLPGKLGMSGDRVWDAYRAGEIERIRHYCETDVLNTYVIWLRFQLLRGRLDADAHAAEIDRLRAMLAASGRPHLREFLDAWRPVP
jgi:predicted PolB exonuclease-like 3'-5' exonuclease